jgi:predicted GNAT superfamily acetyltransferase
MISDTVSISLRDLDGPTLAPFLALNNAHAVELSMLSEAAFRTAVATAMHARGFLSPVGFLLAYDQTATVDSVNFRWFKRRYPRFVYIDRVAISAAGRGKGLARQLYRELIGTATAAGHMLIGCEVNVDPPNPTSDAFHAALDFREIGRAHLADRDKTVRYLAIQTAADPQSDRAGSPLHSS